MQPITVSLVVLALSFSAIGVNVRTRGQAVTGKEKCPTAQEVASSTIDVDGNAVTRQTFLCPEPGALAKTNVTKSKTVARSLLEKRSAAECRTPSPECQCGTNFNCSCFNLTSKAPKPNDCKVLGKATTVVSQAGGPTFLVQPDSFELITFGTCSFEWQNADTAVHEYCWDELASTGGLVTQLCFQEGGGTAAECDADDELWLSQFTRVAA